MAIVLIAVNTTDSITLNWTDTESATNYTVKRSLNGSTWTDLITTEVLKYFQDTDSHTYYTKYYYKVINNDTLTESNVYEIYYQYVSYAYVQTHTLSNPVTKVPNPVITPAGGIFTSAQYVVLTCSLYGATIRYTLDGTDPVFNSTFYNGAILVSENKTIKCIAYYPNLTPSDIVFANFYIGIIPKVPTPIITPNSYEYIGEDFATLTCSDATATIYYTLDGTTPTSSDFTYSAPIPITADTEIRAIGISTGKEDSNIAIAKYNIQQHMPLYLQTNKINITSAVGEDQAYTYSSFDNSSIEVEISKPEDGENDMSLKITNTLTPDFSFGIPTATNRKLLRIDNIDNFSTGDVLILDPANNGKTYYNELKNNKWIIKAKFIDPLTSYHYILLSDNYPTEELDSVATYDNYTFIKFKYSCVIMLNSLRIRGNPVMEATEQPYNSRNELSIARFKKQSYELKGDIISVDDLKYVFDYFKTSYTGLDKDYTKFTIPFELPNRLDLELLDVVRLKDNVYTKFDNEPVIIISKEENSKDLSTKYTGITIGTYEPTASNIQFNSIINYLPINTPEYSHIEDSDVAKVLYDTGQDVISAQIDKYGLITANKLAQSEYSGIIASNYSENSNSILINLTGTSVAIYNLSMINNGIRSVVKVDNEYILIESITTVTSASTSFTAKILKRDIFGKGETTLTNGKIIEFYNILTAINGNTFTLSGSLEIGGTSGQINFKDSGLTLDDYASSYNGFDYLGMLLKETSGAHRFKILVGKPPSFSNITASIIQGVSNSGIMMATQGSTGFIRNYQFVNGLDLQVNQTHPLTVYGLVIGAESTGAPQTLYLNGSIRYNETAHKFEGYENGVWKTFTTS